MIDLKDELLNGMEETFNGLIRKVKYEYHIEGRIAEKNIDGSYKVKINEDIHTIKAIRGDTYEIDDIVYIIVRNNDNKFKYIDFKRP